MLLGANDASLPISIHRQAVPLDQYTANLKAIITHPNITAHRPKILLVTPPPVDELTRVDYDVACGHGTLTHHARSVAKYAQAVREVAAAVDGTVLIDLWAAIQSRAEELTPGWVHQKDGPWLGTPESGTSGGFKKLLSDGLHLTSDGYKLFYSLVAPYIHPGVDLTDGMTWMYPHWRVVSAIPEKQE